MTPEQTPSEVPQTPEEVTVDGEAKVRRISVEAAADELKRFDDLGPDSDEVKKWLADNGITENDQIVANGNVYVANSHDFLTRDLAATQELAVEAARAMLEGPQTSQEDQAAVQPTAEVEALESDIDSRTAEIIEEEPRVTREEAEKIGEEVVEDSGIVSNPADMDEIAQQTDKTMVGEDVLPNDDFERDLERNIDVARSIIRSYEMQTTSEAAAISTDLARAELRLGEFAMLGKTAENAIDSAQQTKDSFDAFLRGIDDYPFPTVQTKLKELAGSLQADANALRSIELSSGEEIRRVLQEVKGSVETGSAELENTDARISGHFNEHVHNLTGLPEDIPETLELNGAPAKALTELDAVVDEAVLSFTNEGSDANTDKPLYQKLERVATQMFDLLNQSRFRPVDSSEIFELSQRLLVALTPDADGSGSLADSYSERAALTERVVKAIGKTRATLDTPFGRG